MKTMYTLLALALTGALYAQIPNSSFEEKNTSGNIGSWGMFFPATVTIDIETGEAITDEIVFDNGLGFVTATTNAHTGTTAMEITNAVNFTTNEIITGRATLFNSAVNENATGWNSGVPLPANTDVELLGFHYKFFPVQNEMAQATIQVFNANMEWIGFEVLYITEPASEFTYTYVPVHLFNTGEPAFISIEFSAVADCSAPVSGTRFIVDDIILKSDALGVLPVETNNSLTVYPSVTTDVLNIAGLENDTAVSILDTAGRQVFTQGINVANPQINVGTLKSGVYFIKASGKQQYPAIRFIKK